MTEEKQKTEETATPCPELALVAVVHGRAIPLYRDVSVWVDEHMEAVGDVDALVECGQWPCAVGCSMVLVCKLELVDDGPSDWPGARESRLDASEHRAPTVLEWAAHLSDEHLWRSCDDIDADDGTGETPDDDGGQS